ncbi:glycerophosphodiester phosphodiesterase family protein [Corallococcus sp. bb12-1]|uniref:glycerophosphodiester phosphodiesterase family protein n=1 Tax=Corallococcus sp. bb12-1 TaxID=2996784 RepID=UPI00226F5725|nr:glycerophosphodiester phosphodiesterase family protein [Corallococcus sp. bb12-1]MCY1044446.1 glycerophosphodiester phosphodiesterase family protein [Corallococcus sp. bb12-1]
MSTASLTASALFLAGLAASCTGPLRTTPAPGDDATVRLMDAARAHAQAQGSSQRPVCSPSVALLTPSATSGRGIDLERLRAAGHPVVVWTVNDLPTMRALLQRGVDGIISDRPDLLAQAVRDFDANADGTPGDLLDADGLIDPKRFDAQGHRGARGLRPENTLPAFEAALDHRMTTLELDTVLTADGVPVLSHDPDLSPKKCRRADGSPLSAPVPIASLPVARLQSDFVCDRLLEDRPEQANDRTLSPEAVAFAARTGLPDAYTVPTLRQVFAFAETQSDAEHTARDPLRARNAKRVRFNVELKRTSAKRDIPPTHGDAVAQAILSSGFTARADVQSFDVGALRTMHTHHPELRTVYLLEHLPTGSDLKVASE